MAEIIAAARSIAPKLGVLYHSDGYFEPILEDLVSIGVNAVNPLQPEHMDALAIRRRFGTSLALWGTVGTQTAFGTAQPAEIRREVAERIRTLGRKALVLSPAYDVDTPEIVKQNLAAFVQACRDFG
jgi:uroporphyrinogen decarboxylase